MITIPKSLTSDQLRTRLRLLDCPGLGGAALSALMAHFSTAEEIFGASPNALSELIGPRSTKLLLSDDTSRREQRTRTINATQVLMQQGGTVLALDLPGYPTLLKHIDSPPWLLWARGNVGLLHQPCVGVVGSRKASRQGCLTAQRFAASLSQAGITVVSGLARGIDTAAHEGALEHQSKTIAIIGTGIDGVYPASQADLTHKIIEEGLLLTEFVPGTPPLATNFPRRNRIIAGLCAGVLVVEAAQRSGSLITARLAIESGREVWAIPGSIYSPEAKGCHQLIRDGAQLVDSTAQILESLGHAIPQSFEGLGPAKQPKTKDPLIALVDRAPQTADTLTTLLGVSLDQVLEKLTTLEISGRVERRPGGLWQGIS